MFDTPMSERMKAAGQTDALNAMLAQVPVGRLGRAQEIADAVLWLCSGASTMVVGHALVVDGGYTIR
jgi:NAD(P)-dependent dehydrogenase (short-subunit alcohol dehydrogenase family)